LGAALGQSVVIDNRPGAGGTIGSDAVAKSDPDGYTLLLGSTSTLAISPALYPKLNYDPLTAFEPIAWVSDSPLVLVVGTSVPARTVQELVAYAKTNPDRLNYGSAGNGTPPHLTAEMFKAMTGTSMVHVPFRGGGPALTSILSGDVQLTFEVMSVVLPHVRDGKMRALAVTGLARSQELPDVPTVAESVVPGFASNSWTGIAAPARTPRAIIDLVNREVNAALQSAEFRAKLVQLGLEPKGGTPEVFRELLSNETRKWADVVRKSGAKLN
jgi:tripartite-type tricarboxylate transporter receptor subunit TctC